MTANLRLIPPAREDHDPQIDAYITWARELRGLSKNTLRVRRGFLIGLALYLGKPLVEATERDLLYWERDKVSGRAPESRNAYVSHARAFYVWAVKTKLLDDDPSQCLTRPKLTRGLPRPISDEDFRLAVGAASPKMRAWLLLGGFCGLRCQEIAGLNWSDLHTAGHEPTLLVRDGKGGKERVVPVPQPVIDALVAHGRQRSGPMFYGLDARQIEARSVSSGLNAFFKRVGIDATAHQLRHRYATTAYRLTKDIRLVQELLGHSSPNTTAVYAAFDQSQAAGMVAAMEEQWAADVAETA
ncbi:Phage integrase family protein [Klenkia marina]|uniref:Phage integrase family protein n=1 Tax=Klenkia marina TaxID=1960309 RepID=A0A1G4X9P7_9ACTN|nr:tyrosine-type recombinase/integrase [Klenkia marina]SCX37931.1 Phage integrase family protein [Klenkia marina]